MFYFLVEDPSTTYFLLGTAALMFACLFWLRRQRKYLIGFGATLLLILGVWLLDYHVVTDSERMMLSIQAMAKHIPAKEFDAAFAHVSERFEVGHVDKTRLRQYLEMVKDQFELESVVVWDLEVVSVSRADRKARLRFFFKPKGNFRTNAEYFLCDSEFVLDADDQWRIRSFKVSNPFVNTEEPIPWPNL